MLKLAVFGHPVTHSLSPRIHGMFAEAAGLEVEYDRIDCPAGQLGEKLEDFRDRGGSGCNLTVPLKAEGLALAAHASRAARDADACNTLVAAEDGWHADNTDGAGLVADFHRLGIDIAGRRVLVLGAGGAVAGILGPLLDRGPDRVRIVNRSLDRAERLAARFVDRVPRLSAAGPDAVGEGEKFDLLIQGTSLGHQGACPTIRPEWLAPGAVAYDLNYGPAFAPFADRCGELGVACHSGIGMLVEQAAVAFELFTGVRPDAGPVHGVLSE
ncbi:MAG: shikimate dehydrogenase [Xanthomonadales bacterium]|nr:shikimate dehydrogenase [Xanthomonadales bacterium]|tara:strand:- start:168 stop:977 length:810 start_codon:yes stop_codon:yes gene_type:complete